VNEMKNRQLGVVKLSEEESYMRHPVYGLTVRSGWLKNYQTNSYRTK